MMFCPGYPLSPVCKSVTIQEADFMIRAIGDSQDRTSFSMSSLSRRACYKCGNVGHYAEVCTSSERLCYNCKQPGHESNQCPHPRTTETKQCYHCQGLGHVQADCPTLRVS